MQKRERLVPVSISILPSILDELDSIAYEKKLPSRSSLITQILTDWLKKNAKRKTI